MLTPCENLELFGHSEARERFLNAFRSGRIAHGWIISGPVGIGKATFAYHMARYLLSGREDRNTQFSPNDPFYRRIIAQSHGDFYVLGDEENSEITIDSVRDLNQFLNQTAREGEWRVVVIDGAEKLNRNAANALLKRLEEPPPQTLFFLITPFPGKLLPTIRSRCQVLPMNSLSDEDVRKVFSAQNMVIPEYVSLAQGSPGRLMRLMEGKGPQIYTDLQKIYAGGSVPSFSQTYGGDEESFTIVEDLLRHFLHHQLLERIQNKSSFFDDLSMNQTLEVYEKVENLFDDCRLAQLDRKATLTCVLANLRYKEAA